MSKIRRPSWEKQFRAVSHDTNDPVVLKAALAAALDQRDSAERDQEAWRQEWRKVEAERDAAREEVVRAERQTAQYEWHTKQLEDRLHAAVAKLGAVGRWLASHEEAIPPEHAWKVASSIDGWDEIATVSDPEPLDQSGKP